MDLLNGYHSESSASSPDVDEHHEHPPLSDTKEHPTTIVKPVVVARRSDRRYLNPAPTPSLLAGRSSALTVHSTTNKTTTATKPLQNSSGALLLWNNPTKATLYQPIQGPQIMDPQRLSTDKPGQMEANVAVDDSTFDEQRTAFQRTGQALNVEGGVITRTTLGYDSHRLEKFQEQQRTKRPRLGVHEGKTLDPPLVEGSDDEVVYGVWGPPSREEQWAADNALSDVAKGVELAPEQLAEREYIQERNRQRGLEEEKEKEPDMDRLVERKMSHLLPPRMQEDDKPMSATSTFHGGNSGKDKTDALFDYKGNSWMASPTGLGDVDHVDIDHHRCFVPKKCVARFISQSNTQGIHRIRLFPKTGHLLLSAGLDGKCQVWSVAKRQLMRTYVGHSAAVRDVQFNLDGTKFVSASFDRYLRLWNTETGDVLQTFTNRRVPYCVQFYPHDDNFFVVGCSDNKIVTYDCTTAEITQEYNHHLGPVNAILFVEDHGTKMISSSDDKKVLIWEWDIGVPIKYVSDPTMHSMPCMTLHPTGQYFCGQSLDNQIVVFQARDRFAMQRKKKYTGHQVAGYACEMSISPDGQFLVSGDGNGKVVFWDWKRHKLLQKYHAHDKGPTSGCVWHPLEPSTVFTCGWDGVIKMWQ